MEENMTPVAPTPAPQAPVTPAPVVDQPTMPDFLQEAKQFDADVKDFTQKASDQELLKGFDAVVSEITGAQQPQTPTPSQEPMPQEDMPSDVSLGGITKDVTLGAMQAPRSIARGAVKGVNEMLQSSGIEEVVRGLKGLSKLPSVIADYATGQLTPEKKQALQAQLTTQGDTLPNLDKPVTETVTGDVIENISQFLTGFGVAGKALKTAGFVTKAGAPAWQRIADSANQGMLADVLSFDEQEQRLSDVIQSVPALQNPVTEYLSVDGDDSLLEAKLKQGVEAAGLGVLAEGVIQGVKVIKASRAAKAKTQEALQAAKATPEVVQQGYDPKSFSVLGDAANESLVIRNVGKKLTTAAKETKGIGAESVTAKAVGGEVQKPFQINFARINGEDDIKAVMDNLVNEPSLSPSIDAARRGVQGNEATLKAAQDINGFADLMKRRTGDAFNAEQIVAARQLYYDTTEKLMETAKLAARPEANDADQFNFRRMLAIHQSVQKEFMGVRAEAGRALQAWRIDLGGGSRFKQQVEETLQQFGGKEVSVELAQKIAAAGNALSTDQLNNIVQRSVTARTIDAAAEAWTLGLLTNPTTHIVNVGSNILTGLHLGVERLAQTALPNSKTPIQEGIYYFKGFMEAQKEAMLNAAKAFKTGQTGFGLGKLEAPYTRATSKDILLQTGDEGSVFRAFAHGMDWWGGLLSKYVGGSLAAGDEYGKTLLYRAQLHSLAAREGVEQGLDGKALKEFIASKVADPNNAMATNAMDFADYGTYTKALSGLPANIQSFVARNPAFRLVAPFIRTPMNIFKFAFERTPVALMMRGFRDDIAAGGVRSETALAKLGTGTAIMAMATDFALQGKITGAGPQDPETQAALKRTGWQPYSLKVGDKYVSYSRWEPFATLLGMSADISEITSNYEAYDIAQQQEVDKLVLAGAAAVSNQLVGKTFMQGFADMIEMFSDPARYAATWSQRMAGSIVPAGVAAVERAISPELSFVTSEIDAIKSRIPGLSATVPPRLNVWGEEIKAFYPNEEGLAANVGERFLSLVNPVYYSRAKDEPVDTFMLQNGFEMDMPEKRQSFKAFGEMGSDSVMVDLREYPEMYSRLVKLRGQEVRLAKYGDLNMKEFLNEVFTDGSMYSNRFFGDFTSYDDQQAFIQGVVKDYTKEAKKILVDEYPVIQQIVDDELQKRIILNQNRGAQ